MKGDEMVYTFNLRRAYEKPRTKRARVAVKLLRELAMRHAKASSVVVSNRVNAIIWQHGLKKPPRKVRVKLKKVGDTVYVLDINEELKAPKPKEATKAEEAKEAKKAKAKAKAKEEKGEKEKGATAKKATKAKSSKKGSKGKEESKKAKEKEGKAKSPEGGEGEGQ